MKKQYAPLVVVAIALIAVLLAAGQSPEVKFAADSGSLTGLTISGPSAFTFRAGPSGSVTITAAGKVSFDGTVDDAARAFWGSVGTHFGDFKEAVLAGYKARLREESDGLPVTWKIESESTRVQLGMRSDGVVVWRKAEPWP